MSLRGRCVRGSGGGRRGGRVRMEHVAWIDETGWHETLIAVAMSQHPEPIRIVAIQHRHELAPLDAHVVFVSRHERVENDVPPGRWILRVAS